MKLSEAIRKFIEYMEMIDRSPATVQGYQNDLNYLLRYLEDKHNCTAYLEDVTVEDIEGYLSFLRVEKRYTASSRKRKLACFCTLYKFCVKKRLCEVNVASEVMPIKQKQVERTYLTEEEVVILTEELDHPLIQLVVKMLYYTGLRISECIHLTLDDVNFERNWIRVIEGKGGKDRTIPMNLKLKELLVDYMENWRAQVETPYFFCTFKSGKLHRNYVNLVIRQALKRLDWNRKITAHTLRHSFASNLVKKEVNIVKIQKLLGHSSLTTTSVYTHTNLVELEDAVNHL